jgi:P4 family phage/plasmid primase-like protien
MIYNDNFMNLTDRTIHTPAPANEASNGFERTITEEELTGGRIPTDAASKHDEGNWALHETKAAQKLHCHLGSVRCIVGEWYIQENGIWVPRSKDEYRALALEVLPPKWRTHYHALQVINRLESEKQVNHSVFCGAAKFDGDGAVLLAVKNGTLKISSDKVILLATDPNSGFTTYLPIEWDEDAQMQLFGQVLNNALPDTQDRDCLLDVLATALIPDCRYEAALVLQGESGTSKSTVIAPIVAMFGSSSASLSMADLCHPSGYKLAMLDHKLINLATELNTLEIEDTGLFKQMVSGETFTARPIYGKPFEMRSTATLVFLANSLPRFKNGTNAEVRRLRFIRFGNQVTNPDVKLKAQIAQDAPGVFVDLVYRAQALLAGRPLTEPGKFGRETSQRFAVSNDPVGQFVTKVCTLGANHKCEKTFIGQAFDIFRMQHGISDKFDDALFFRELYNRFPSVQCTRPRGEGNSRIHVLVGITLQELEGIQPVVRSNQA